MPKSVLIFFGDGTKIAKLPLVNFMLEVQCEWQELMDVADAYAHLQAEGRRMLSIWHPRMLQ